MSNFGSRAGSPLPEPVTHSRRKSHIFSQQTSRSALEKCSKFVNRLFHVNHMDFEFACWQMINLMVAPSKVFRNATYRKQTKNQYSRDDPAFLLLLGLWFLISSTALSFVLGLNLLSLIKFLFWIIFVDCIGVGLVIATLGWLVANHYFRKLSPLQEDVEWGFAFDVHLNAFFPPLLILHVFQLIFFKSKPRLTITTLPPAMSCHHRILNHT